MMNSPGWRIRSTRKSLNYSQAHLAKLVGISQSSLCELELGESKMPSAKVLHDLARELGVSPVWIMTGKEGELETLTKHEEQVIQSLRSLKVEQQRAIYGLIKSMQEGESDG
jgi:transcriptional regulator with XRE-family HTH domain